MRRIVTTLGALAAAAMISLTVPTSAGATSGVLVVKDFGYIDPSGCYDMKRFDTVINHTNDIAYILQGPGCTGELDFAVHPGESAVAGQGRSIWID